MRLADARVEARQVRLTVPYRIAGRSYDAAEMLFVTLEDETGMRGYGAATPVEHVTGDTFESAGHALTARILPALRGADVSDLDDAVTRARVASMSTRSALAAFDIALHDLHAKRAGLPLHAWLGGIRRRLITSVTIGIDDLDVMVAAARRHVERGFKALKVKIGEDADGDIERLNRIRDAVGPDIRIRVDANEGYTVEQAERIGRRLDELGVELFEQPISRHDLAGMWRVGKAMRAPVLADEAVRVEGDLPALVEAGAARGVNIKLMKCGGVSGARAIDRALATVGWKALVGCMDESRVSIAAAAHFAAASASVEWVDLDGHFDLAEDPFTGGVELRDGELVLSEEPGLGVSPAAG